MGNNGHKSTQVDKDQPPWVCHTCGVKYGFFRPGICTWHKDTCGVCNELHSVTDPRDFGYLVKGWKEKHNANQSE